MAVNPRTRAEILRLYCAETWKIGTIARQLGLHLTNPELVELASETGITAGDAEAVGSLIRSWAGKQDAGEHRETVDALVEGQDRERQSVRKLFPEALKGRSW